MNGVLNYVVVRSFNNILQIYQESHRIRQIEGV